jgi:hypothetical protein
MVRTIPYHLGMSLAQRVVVALAPIAIAEAA